MANGTPSNTVPLGSDILTAMGDIKGAAKAMADEAKSAKADAKEATKELKAAEREAKKANDAIDKLKKKGGTVSQEQRLEAKRLDEIVKKKTDEAFRRGQVESEKAVKLDRAKTKIELERDRLSSMNQFERRINGRLMGVKDTLQSVGNRLQGSSIPALQSVGKQLGGAAGSITSESLSGVVELGGGALRVAGIAGAGVAGGFAVAGFVQSVVNRNLEQINIQGRIDDTLTRSLSSFAGTSVSGEDASRLSAEVRRQESVANMQTQQESIVARVIGTEGFLAEQLGIAKTATKRKEDLGKIILDNALISEKFGQNIADSLDVEKLAKSKGVNDLVQREADKSFVSGVAGKLAGDKTIGRLLTESAVSGLSAIGYDQNMLSASTYKKITDFIDSVPGANTSEDTILNGIVEYLYKSEDSESANKFAREQREKQIANIQEQIEYDQERMRQDVKGASQRKIAAVRDQSLEAERLRRNMQTARF